VVGIGQLMQTIRTEQPSPTDRSAVCGFVSAQIAEILQPIKADVTGVCSIIFSKGNAFDHSFNHSKSPVMKNIA
jgi:hypothetical protein